MKAVKSLQKYKCDFCTRRSVKSAMQRHETICFKNPNRYCSSCKNTGKVLVAGGNGDPEYYDDCFYCKKLDKTLI